ANLAPVDDVPRDARHANHRIHCGRRAGLSTAILIRRERAIVRSLQHREQALSIAFNTGEGWSQDVTREIAEKLLDLNNAGTALGAAAREFVERITGKSAKAIV